MTRPSMPTLTMDAVGMGTGEESQAFSLFICSSIDAGKGWDRVGKLVDLEVTAAAAVVEEEAAIVICDE